MVVSDGLKNILPGHAICSEACSMWRVTRCQSFTMLTGLSQVFLFTVSSIIVEGSHRHAWGTVYRPIRIKTPATIASRARIVPMAAI